MVLLGVFQALMGRYARQEELLVGSPVAGRNRGETEGLIGLFVNTLVLRGDLTGDPGFGDLLARVRETALDAYAHQDLPFETLVEGLAPERDLSRSPVFQVLFGLQNTAPLARELAPGLSLRLEEGLTEQAKFDLKLMLDEDGEGNLTGGWEYCTDLFEPATVRRIADGFTRLLAGVAADPQARLWELPLLGDEERRQVVLQGAPGPDGGLVHERFAAWAARTPEAPALAYEGTVLTFRELDGQANRLARHLRRLGVGPETPVGVRLERSLGMVVAILGILKAGGAYVPLDPEFPEDRLAFMLEDSGAQALVTEEILNDLNEESTEPLESLAGPANLAYVIYTSGSTGRPKGVMVEHRQLSSYVDGVLARMALPEGASYATVSTIAADLGNTVVFASLATGGLLHVISHDRLGDSLRLAEYFDQHSIDALKIVPSHLAALERVMPRRLLVTGGEALPWSLVDRVRETAPDCRVLNHYGPTETTVGVLAFPVPAAADRRGSVVPLGRPLGGTRVVVVDDRLLPVPAGVPGELLVGGPQVTRGYLGRPDLTAERFVPDAFGDPGARLYRTGDLARLLPGGDVEFLGRIDHQVKVRGFRVEPGEIEAALRTHPDVREALVLAKPLPAGENRLVAYVVPREGADGLAAELRRQARELLPEALVPSAFVFLPAIPLTPNGKVDRRALPEPETTAPMTAKGAEAGALAALSPVEAVVAGIFGQLLGLDRVEADGDFFALGGHSLLAMRALALLRKAFDTEIDLRMVFEGRTVAGLARRIEERLERRILADAPPLVPLAPPPAGTPLSFNQESLWFLDRLEPGSTAYNVPRILRLRGALSVPGLAAALGGLTERHEILRTVYGEMDGEPRQRVLPFKALSLPVVDLESLPEPRRQMEAERLAELEASRPIDLSKGPLFRALLLRAGPAEHTLLILTHHIASDGGSLGVLVKELAALYSGQALPPLPLQYADFAAWQRRWLTGPTLDAQAGWWRHELAGEPGGLNLPADRPRPRMPTARGGVERFTLPPSLSGDLERLGQRHGATLFMTLLAAFQALLHRYTGEADLRVGTSVSGRGRAEVADLIGFFVNTLVLRGDLSGRPSFLELLSRVRESALGAYAHQDLPFVKLVEALAPDRGQAQMPLFQTLFALERPAAAPGFALGSGLAATLEEPAATTAKLDLTVVLEPAGESLVGSAEYSSDLFDAATVRRLLGHFENLLAGLAAEPGRPLAEIPYLGEDERRQLIAGWNEAAGIPGTAGIPAGLTSSEAIIAEGRTWSHAELEARTAALARQLRRLGVGPETVVGVLLDRSPEAIATLLGVLRAGGAYLPLDPAYPSERLAFMLSDSGASLLVTRRSLWPALPGAGIPVLELEGVDWTGTDDGTDRNTDGDTDRAGSLSLAYVLYTSGSTGQPKGVGVPRAALASRTAAMARLYELAPGDRVLQLASLSFDVAAEEIFPTLASGGAVVLPADSRQIAPADLGALAGREGITVLNLPSPVWHEWVDALPETGASLPASLRLVVVGSDAVSAERLAGWQRKTGNRIPLFNAYGLTETTVTATAHRIENEAAARVPIGQPVEGARAYVVDSHGEAVPLLVPGELWIGGSGLARGYLHRPDLTAERFLPDPFSGEPGARLYRTGDLVRRRGDGALEFLGRIDAQLKVRGFRIEPGEVEAALAAHPGIAQAAVGVRDDCDDRLVAYLVPRPGTVLETGEIRGSLERRLSLHMVPSLFAFLEALPLTPSGKVDRRALALAPLPQPPDNAHGGTPGARTPSETLMADLFAGLLGLEDVGNDDNFFHLGGHSLLAARLVAQVREAFGAELPLKVVFETPTAAALAAWIDGAREETAAPGEEAAPEPPLPERETGPRTLPASFAQQRLWLLDRLQNGASAMYNMPSVLHLQGPLRIGALAQALDEIVRRHEVLRTVFEVVDGQPVQAVQPFVPAGLPVVDLEAGADVRELVSGWSRQPFDLEHGPVFRASLLRRGGRDHVLLLNVHHIASDGWSNGILTHELGLLYQAFAAGLPSPLPELPLQYGDYAAWQRRWLSGGVLEEQLTFWRGRLGTDPEPLELPLDRPRPAVQSGHGAVARRNLPPGFGGALERLARPLGVTSFMAFLAAFQGLLVRYTGREDLIVGTPVANRDRLEVEGLIGCFVNTLALRTDLSGDPPFLELLERVRETALSSFVHQDLPFERLVEELVSGRDLSRTPICQVTFTLQQETAALPVFGPELRVALERSHHDTAKFDLALFLGRFETEAELMAEYSTDLFEAATVERLLGHLAVLVEGIEADPRARLSELPLLGAEERTQLLAWNEETRRERPEELVGSTLHALFEAQARRTPEKIAVIADKERLTYAALEARAAALARALPGLGVGPEVGVGIFLERTPEMIVALLATLKAGGFYVPLDPAYPAERVGFMLEDSDCAVVLTSTDLQGRLDGPARTVLLDQELPAAPAVIVPVTGPGRAAGSGNLAYLIYTSGSTGRPKAVAIEHRSAVAMVLWSRREFSDLELSGVLASTSITFDMSVFEIFAPLAWGGTLILAENALALPQLPARGEVKVIDTVPSAMAELVRTGGVPPSVVTVNLGGEAVPRALADQVYSVPGIERLYNVYGPSEDTTFSTWALIERRSEPAPSVGRPLDGEQGWVVDRHFNLAPVGVPGELYLAGEGLARGYLGRPDLTAERYLPNPFSAVPGARMYRVGDLVRHRPDGELEFLGRLDNQVKIRGFRVELGEIEEALLRLPGIEGAAVLFREEGADRRLVAFCAGTGEPDALRQALRERLPEYMVPSAFAFLAALPLTPNGKVDRRALAKVAVEAAQPDGEEHVPPRGPVEEMVAEAAASLLGLERVGRDDDFFHLGGHSLLAARLVARIREVFGVGLSLRAVFETPTVAGLARRIEEGRSADPSRSSGPARPAPPPLLAQARPGAPPASFAQQRLWLVDRLRRGSDNPELSAAYNMPSLFRIHGPLRHEALGAALDEIVRRHKVLRTVFGIADGQPVQIVQPFEPRELPVVAAGPGEDLDRLLEAWSLAPFDLEHGPVFRAELLRLEEDEHLLLLNVHHIASDGWSAGILVHELGLLYQAFAEGRPSPLPPLPVQYADYAVWQRGWLNGEVLDEQLAFWRGNLGMDPEPLELPADHPRPAVQSGRGGTERRRLPAGLGERLESLALARGATPFMAHLAVFQALLHRYTGRADVTVGTPVANRDRQDVEGLIGCFVNTVALRTDLSGDPAFPEVLDRVRETALSAFGHQDLPFERLVEELVTGRDLSRPPLCQVTFVLQQGEDAALQLGPGLRVAPEPSHSNTAKFDLVLFAGRSGQVLELLAEYSTDLFEGATVRRWLGHLGVLIAGIEERPEARLSELPLLDAAERAQLLAWNQETRRQRQEDLVGSTLHALFEAQARRTPDAVALIAGEERLSYTELEARAEALARSLRGLGVGPEVGAGIFLERKAELVVALLATLKAGGFYVPLDPAYPAERVGFMLEDSDCAVVLTDTDLQGRLHGLQTRTVLLDQELPAAPAVIVPVTGPGRAAGSGNLAYLIYTSGSTGRPKAVAIEHRSAVAMVLWSRREFSDLELSGVLASTSITFDMSVFEIFAPLAWGGTVILAENALALPGLSARDEVRVIDTVPSAMAELIRMDGVPASAVTVNLGGEAIPRALADRVYALPNVERLYNVYGPSEDTTFSTWALIERKSERAPAIGRPLDGEQGWVVDRHFNVTPVGVPGELYLAGEGLARGYLGRPDLTAERYIPNPFSAVPGARMYRVGDLVRHRPDGEMEFLGRLDHQVKIRGFRVELGEVEEALSRLRGVEAAVVLARDGALAAYVVTALEASSLREALRRRLPEYMVPTAFVFLDALPLTPNGKVDRRALAKLAVEAGPAAGENYVAPRGSLEEAVAGIFASLLGVERVGAETDFFELGGHSLLAARMVARIRELFGVELSLRAVFETPTVAGLARCIEESRPSGQAVPALRPREGQGRPPASFAQQRLWFVDRLRRGPDNPDGSAAYNMPSVFRIHGSLRPERLAEALDEIVRRHEVLRTVFAVEDGQPVQIVQPFEPRPLPVVTVATGAEIEQRVREWSLEPFDLEHGPVFRAELLKLEADEHLLLLNVHHIASDGWSHGVLVRELGTLYQAFAEGLPSPLPPLPIQYADYAVWQRDWLSGEVLDEQLAFWRERLGLDPEPLELPADHPRPAVQSGRGGGERRTLRAGLGDRLESLAQARGATPFMAYLAAFQALLHRYTGRADVTVGTPVANRNRLDVEGLIGCFVNTVALHTDLSGDPAFPDLLERVRETALSSFGHQDLPFERLVEELVTGRDLSRTPLCQVAFVLQQGEDAVPRFGPGLRVEPEASHSDSAKFDLVLFAGRSGPRGHRMELLAEYSTDLFEGTTIQRLLGHLSVLVAGIEERPEARLSELPLLEAAERAQLLAWNEETRRERPEDLVGSTLHALFEAQARRTPEKTALIAGEERLSYAALEARAEALAGALRGLGVGPEVGAGIFLERKAELVVALLATLKAGGFYVPLDPAYPAERVGFMLEDSRCAVVLTDTDLQGRLDGRARTVLLDQELPAVAVAEPGRPAGSGNLSYLIYTSGSTGRPKAVAIEHRSAVAMVLWSRREFSDLELSGVLASTSITFDMSVFEIFAPLAWGGTVILAENALALPRLPARDEVRVIDTVPSAMAELIRMDGVPASAVTVNLGGEAIPRALADRVYAVPGIERLYNVYGPSEDTTFSTWALIERKSERAPAIGRPLDGEQGWVVDRHLNITPVGVPGELYLAGEGLARGYLGRPDLTAERYVPNPFSAVPGARMYRVGDLVRHRPDGEMEFLGRLDHQVKIRGFRVELGEVEEALSRLPGVEAAVVLARDGALAAYLVTGLEASSLREALRRRLPEYMVPTAFVFLDALPLTPNGKVDRRALAKLSVAAGPAAGDGYVAPRGPLEEAVAGIFASLLGVERVGAETDFFELGGHSLLAARLVARIRELFGADLSLRAVFETPTVAGLARLIEESRSEESRPSSQAVPALRPREAQGRPPASFAQQRLWFVDRLRRGTDGAAAYNMPSVFRIHGSLRPEILAAALNEIVRRHEVLRTVFAVEDGQPVQVVLPFEPRPLPVRELKAGDGLDGILREWSLRPFDLEHGPVFRAELLRLEEEKEEEEHLLLLNVHHVASDGWSSGILIRELSALYRAFAAGEPSPLPPLPIQYADYAVWQRGWLAGTVLEEQVAFWRDRLGMDPEPLELPADHARPPVQSGRGRIERHSFPAGVGGRLERLAQRQGATPFMAFLAAFQTLLHRYTGRTDLSAGTPVANRGHVEVEGLIGCFVNTLVLRTDLSGDPAFPALLERVRDTSLSSFEHQELPFERLVEELVPGRDLSRPPLAQVAFSLQQETAPLPAFGPGLRVEAAGSHGATAKFDLALFLGHFERGVEVLAEYSTDLFEAATVRRLLGHLGVLVAGIEEHPEARLSQLPLLGAAERAQLLAWNEETRRPRPEELVESTLHELFEAQARRTPERIAVIAGTERISYADLEARAETLAASLRGLGVGPETGAGIFLERKAELVVALLATLKAGGFYVPLDPAYPAERVGFMLEDSRCAVVLTSTDLQGRLHGHPARIVLLDQELPAAMPVTIPVTMPATVPGRPAGSGNLAYLIYTSGSTGRPKAVAIEHRSAVAMVLWSRREFSDLELSGVLASTSITFDMSVFEIFAPLAWGGTLILAENALALPHLPARNEVRVVDTVPSAIAELIRMGGVPPSAVTVNLGGEPIPRALADRVYGLPGVERLYNVYGPSEDTTFSTWALVERASERAPSIGRPLDGEQGWVVDGHFNVTPVGVPGELYLAGEGLARGYLSRPDLTAERYVPNPFSTVPGARMYRVGDLVRHRTDGELEFLGRIDNQVKIRGFRVELGEVEEALSRLPGVEAAVVLARAEHGANSLAAYVAPPLETAALREGLRQRLPDYMVPTAFLFLDSLPLTPNGKVDRRALAKLPLEVGARDGAGFVAPRNAVEQQMADIWADVLGVEKVGVHDTFWDLGGHSLLATRVLSRLYESLGVELPLADAVRAAHGRRAGRSGGPGAPGRRRRGRGPVPGRVGGAVRGRAPGAAPPGKPLAARPAGPVSRPTGFVSRPMGFVSRPMGFVSCPAGFVSQPVGFLLFPTGFLLRPMGRASCPVGFLP